MVLATAAALTIAAFTVVAAPAKYVFLFIGDGMGSPQIAAAEAFLGDTDAGAVSLHKLNFTQFPVQALTTTHAADRYITGSAAAATAMACGYKTNIGVISMDPSLTQDYRTIAEIAKDAGMKVGIVSSVNVDHATPAAFYAHETSRNNYYQIGLDLIDSDVDYCAGGMLRVDKAKENPSQHDLLANAGWTVAGTRTKFLALDPSDSQVYAYTSGFAGNALPYVNDEEYVDITLAEFTAKGIELLNNPNGFFMMVEGGKIDWACHANDAASSIANTEAFENAVQEAIDFYNAHPHETLIIVTGDHECGGLTLGFAGTGYGTAFAALAGQSCSYEYFDAFVLAPYRESVDVADAKLSDLEDEIAEYFGLTDWTDYERAKLEAAFVQSIAGNVEGISDTEQLLLYGGYEPLTVTITHLLDQRAGLAWTSYKHTGVPVPTFVMGAGQELFGGYIDNTDIFWKMVEAMGLSSMVATN
jgi:alkaline phosphatase